MLFKDLVSGGKIGLNTIYCDVDRMTLQIIGEGMDYTVSNVTYSAISTTATELTKGGTVSGKYKYNWSDSINTMIVELPDDTQTVAQWRDVK